MILHFSSFVYPSVQLRNVFKKFETKKLLLIFSVVKGTRKGHQLGREAAFNDFQLVVGPLKEAALETN